MSKHARFMNNSYITSANLSSSSSDGSYPLTNIIDDMRSRVFKFDSAGNFIVTTSNNKVYYTLGGSPVTSTLTAGTYTATGLASHFSAVVSGLTLTYNSITKRFNLANDAGPDETYRGTETTNSVSSLIGFNDVDVLIVGSGSIDGHKIRVHSYETIDFDFLGPLNPTFFGLIWPINEASGLSENAVIELRANNVVDMDTPDLTINLQVSDNGIFHFMDLAQLDNDYRYWQVRIEDKTNPNFYADFCLSYTYLGDHFDFSTTNIAQGFSMELVDPSIRQESEGGQAYYLLKNKYYKFDAMQTQLINKADRNSFQQLFFDLGVSSPFFISIDPETALTNNLDDLTKFARIEQSPKFTHVFLEYFNMSFSMREVV